jgi:hypothetical protein
LASVFSNRPGAGFGFVSQKRDLARERRKVRFANNLFRASAMSSFRRGDRSMQIHFVLQDPAVLKKRAAISLRKMRHLFA